MSGTAPSAGINCAYVRWFLLCSALLGELVVLSIWFDTGALSRETGWFSWLIQHTPLALQACVGMVVAVLAFSGAEFKDRFSGLNLAQPHQSWPIFFCLHLIAFAGFVVTTSWIFTPSVQRGLSSEVSILAWTVSAIAWLGLWGLSMFRTGDWLRLYSRVGGLVPFGLAVGVAAVCSGLVARQLWKPLGAWTFETVRFLLDAFAGNAISRPEELVLGTQSFTVQIAPSCSGYEGIGLIWVFLAVYLWTSRTTLRFPHAFLLVPLGTLAIWLANAVRIALLVMVGTWGSSELALGGFHSQVGWLAFNVVALGIVWSSRRSKFFSLSNRPAESQSERGNPSAPFLVPFLAILATTMVSTALVARPESLYPLRVVVTLVALWWFRDTYRELLRWTWSWEPFAIGIVVCLLWLMMLADDKPTSNLAVPGEIPAVWLAAWFLFRFIGYGITVPIAEELAFRGYLTRRMISAEFENVPLGKFTWFSFITSSALFGMMHGGLWLPGTLAGLLFATALYRRGRLIDAILAHATTNGLIAAYALATGDLTLLS